MSKISLRSVVLLVLLFVYGRAFACDWRERSNEIVGTFETRRCESRAWRELSSTLSEHLRDWKKPIGSCEIVVREEYALRTHAEDLINVVYDVLGPDDKKFVQVSVFDSAHLNKTGLWNFTAKRVLDGIPIPDQERIDREVTSNFNLLMDDLATIALGRVNTSPVQIVLIAGGTSAHSLVKRLGLDFQHRDKIHRYLKHDEDVIKFRTKLNNSLRKIRDKHNTLVFFSAGNGAEVAGLIHATTMFRWMDNSIVIGATRMTNEYERTSCAVERSGTSPINATYSVPDHFLARSRDLQATYIRDSRTIGMCDPEATKIMVSDGIDMYKKMKHSYCVEVGGTSVAGARAAAIECKRLIRYPKSASDLESLLRSKRVHCLNEMMSILDEDKLDDFVRDDL